MINENKFTYGEYVKIKDTAPSHFCPGRVASVCGIIRIQTKTLAERYQSNIGEWIYTIEYIGGSDTEIPESYLEKYEVL